MTRKELRKIAKKQGLRLDFDPLRPMVKAFREDGSVAFEGPIYALEAHFESGEAL